MPGSLWRILSETYAFAKALLRYKETLFWVVAFPLLWYGLMVAIWGSPGFQQVDVAVANLDEPVDGFCLGDLLVEAMNESGLFRVIDAGDPGSLEAMVANGTVYAGILVPEGFTERLLGLERPKLVVYTVRGQWSDYAAGVVESFLSRFADEVRHRMVEEALRYLPEGEEWTPYAVKWMQAMAEPFQVRVEERVPPLLATPEGLRAYYALSMVGVEALFVGLFAGVLSLNERRAEGTLPVILSSPMKPWELLAADTLSALAAVGVSAAAITAASLAIGADYAVTPAKAAAAALLLAAGTLFTVGLGLLLAPIPKTPSGAGALVNAIAFPVMFAGGIIIPPYALPEWLRGFSRAWPLSITLEETRRLLVYDAPIASVLANAAPALAATLIVYALGALVYARLLARAVEYG